MDNNVYQYTGAIIDVIACGLFAKGPRYIKPARVLCLIANILWIIYGIKTEQYGIMGMNMTYGAIIIYALYNYGKNYDDKLKEIK